MKAIGRSIAVVVPILILALSSQAQIGQVRGELLGTDGEPLEGAKIILDQREGGGTLHYELETNSRGEFIHLSVTPAFYQLTLEIDGEPTAVVGVRVSSGPSPMTLDLSKKELESFEFSRELGNNERIVRELIMAGDTAAVADSGGDSAEAAARAEAAATDAAVREAFDAGRAAMALEDYQEAIRQFTLAAEGNSTEHVIYGNLAQAYERAGQFAEAAEQYERAQEVAIAQEVPPETANYYGNLTLVHARAGNVERAIANAEKAAEIDPKVAGQSFYNLGAVMTNAGQTQGAVEAFKRAVEVDPEMAQAYFELGLAYVGSDSLDEAVPVFERYLELVPDGPDADTARGLLEFAAGQ